MYFKGKLVNVQEIDLNYLVRKYKLNNLNLLDNEKKKVKELLTNTSDSGIIKNNILRNYLNKMCLNANYKLYSDIKNLDGIEIIYTVEKDVFDNLYAKEILTNCLFPIFTPGHLGFNYELLSLKDNRVEINSRPKLLSYALFNPEIIVSNSTLANEKDIKSYKKQSKELFLNQINNLYFRNIPKYNIKDEKFNNLKIEYMKKIESLIVSTLEKSKDEWLRFKLIYENMLKNGFTLFDLMDLEIEINCCLFVSNPSENTYMSYINCLKSKKNIEFLNNIKNQNIKELKELDKLTKMFLQNRNNYLIDNQILILRNLSFLYFIVVYNDKENISVMMLNNSLFKQFVKEILVLIKSLAKDNVIDVNMDLNVKYIDVEILFAIIKQVELKPLDNNKIKKMNLF